MRFPSKFLYLICVLSMNSWGSDTDCGNNEQARALARLILTDDNQQRTELRCNQLLSQIAVEKAQLMVQSELVMHNLGGSPNNRLRKAGYKLPSYYGASFSNQVEAIAGGYTDAESVWRAFKRSNDHRQHLLGELPFYLEQDELGVAFLKDRETAYVEYWVVYLTKGYSPDQTVVFTAEQIPNKSELILQPFDNRQE